MLKPRLTRSLVCARIIPWHWRSSWIMGSSSRSHDDNCVMHTRRSRRSVCTGRPLGSRSVGGRSRSKRFILHEKIMRTSAPCINVLFHVPHPHPTRPTHIFSPSARVRVMLNASRPSVREAMTSSTSEKMRVRHRELTAWKRSLVH